jgi:hypothetical protein
MIASSDTGKTNQQTQIEATQIPAPNDSES